MTSAGPHFDDDALSAHLDGLPVEGAAEHLALCGECRARSEALAEAATLVAAAPALPPASVVDAAVAQALDAEIRSARRPLLVAVAAAALVVLGIVGASVLGDEERPSDSDTAALSNGERSASGGAVSDSAEQVGGDLGDLDDPAALSERVKAVIEPPPEAAESGGGGGSAAGDDAAVMSPTAARAYSATSDGKQAREDDDPHCLQAVADEYDTGLGELVYRATLRWDGTDAVAVAYRLAEPNGELDHRLFVLARGSCQLLVAQTF